MDLDQNTLPLSRDTLPETWTRTPYPNLPEPGHPTHGYHIILIIDRLLDQRVVPLLRYGLAAGLPGCRAAVTFNGWLEPEPNQNQPA